jgi:hypothetical protein
MGSVTDTLNYNWDCAYANEFPVAVEGLDGDKMRTIAKDAIGLMRGHNFAGRLSGIRTQIDHLRLKIAAKFTHSVEAVLPGKSAGCALSLGDIPWHSAYIWRKKHG